MSSIDFDKLYPWRGIELVTIDEQKMVKIPKFYVKVGIAPAGTDQAGKKCWWISDTKRNGYHVHPAFMKNGREIEQFYLGAYEAYNAGSYVAGSAKGKSPWVSVNYDQALAACLARNKENVTGFHLQTIYERSAVVMLCMVEKGPDVQTTIGAGNSSSSGAVLTGNSNAVYRNMHELWGNVWEWIDGVKTDNDGTTVRIFDKNGYSNYVNTNAKLTAGSGLGIQAVSTDKGDDYDLSDVFIPSTVSGAATAATFKDGYWHTANAQRNVFVSGDWDSGASCGLFTWYSGYAPSNTNGTIGFRLAKW